MEGTSFASQPQKPRLWGAAVACVVLMFTAIAMFFVGNLQHQRAAHNIDHFVETISAHLQRQAESYTALLQAAASLFVASDQVDRDEWHDFIGFQKAIRENPELFSISYFRRVLTADRDGFVNEIRKDESLVAGGYPFFAIHPAGNRAEYYVATYVEPMSVASGTMGFDALSDDRRATTISRARDAGTIAATVEAQLTNGRPGLILYQPLYRGHSIPLTIALRRSEVRGVIGAAFDVQASVDTLLHDHAIVYSQDIYLEIRSANPNDEPLATIGIPLMNPAMTRSFSVPVGETGIEVVVHTTATYGLLWYERYGRAFAMGLGLLIAALLYMITASFGYGRVAASRMVRELEFRKTRDAEAFARLSGELQSRIAAATDVTRQQLEAATESRTAMLSVLEDFTVAKSQLERARAFDRALLASIADGVFVINTTGVITEANVAATQLLERTAGQLIDHYAVDAVRLYHEDGTPVPLDERLISKALRAKQYQVFSSSQYYYVRSDGTKFPIAVEVAPIMLDGVVSGVVEVFRDISTQKEIDRAKSEFVSLASHQLRTPLTAIGWYAELLLGDNQKGLSTMQLEALQQIHESNRRMTDLIDSLLNVSRLEMGSFTIEPVPTQVATLMPGIVSDMRGLIQQKKVSVLERYDQYLPVVGIDRKLWGIIATNLISNAIKYSQVGGQVVIELAQDAQWLQLRVTDSGIGIPVSQQPRVFQKLFRADNALTSQESGTGLGLYMVRSIVDAVGGEISFTSEEGKGTTFEVRIPRAGMASRKGLRQLIDTSKATPSLR